MASRTSDLVGRVDSAHELNFDSLLRYCSVNVKGFPHSPSNFSVSQFGHGQSNPTYLLEVNSDPFVMRYVLRKKPPGKLLQSAHAVEREYQVLHALGIHTEVPVPKVFCLCTDLTVIGTPFYIMEYLDGRIFIDPGLPGLAPSKRRAIYRATAKTLASLHSANVDVIGLGKYGRRNDYCKRQVERWGKQYILSTGEGKSDRNPRMLELVDWLRLNIPSEDSSGATSGLVHGDFRIDNLVFHPVEDRVIGIIDWELSTLGNQMCDVAYSGMHYIVDVGLDTHQHDGFEVSGIPEGIPSLAEYLTDYCSTAGKPWPVSQWKFYVAFSLFRAASIYAGVHSRWIMGNASGGERARRAGETVNIFVDTAWSFIGRQSVLPQYPPGVILQDNSNESGRFAPNKRIFDLRNKIIRFMEDRVYPLEPEFYKLAHSDMRWTIHPEEEKLKELAKKQGLWNLFIPRDSAARARELLYDGRSDFAENFLGAGLSNLEYGYLCEVMGRSVWAPQVFNCGAPDTGNMEVLLRYGSKEQLQEWLIPLLDGTIRSGFAMTEPQVASSDATNIECSIKRDGDSYIINGKKWWTSGAMDPRCRLLIVMGKTDFTAPKHRQQSMILVDMKTPGIHIKRPLTVFGFDDAPHGHAEMLFENVRVPAKNILLGEGRGFEIAQGRLGPGRLHHCMRLIGAAERGMQLMVQRALTRTTFGKLIAQHGSFQTDIAKLWFFLQACVLDLGFGIKCVGIEEFSEKPICRERSSSYDDASNPCIEDWQHQTAILRAYQTHCFEKGLEQCRIELEQTRLLVLEAADQLDRLGNKKARGTIAMAKVAAPNMALKVIDRAIQVHGGAGVSSDTVLAHLWATSRTLRIADGPDEVHLGTIAKLELQRAKL